MRPMIDRRNPAICVLFFSLTFLFSSNVFAEDAAFFEPVANNASSTLVFDSLVPDLTLSLNDNTDRTLPSHGTTTGQQLTLDNGLAPMFGYGILGFLGGILAGLTVGVAVVEIFAISGALYADMMMIFSFGLLGGVIGSGTAVYATGNRYGGNGSWLASTFGAFLGLVAGVFIAPALPLIVPIGAILGYRLTSNDDRYASYSTSPPALQPVVKITSDIDAPGQNTWTSGIGGRF